MTNLSYKHRYNGITPHWRLMFQPTFHPEFASLEKFKENAKWLKTQGFNVTSQQIFQNDGKFNRIKEFFTQNWFENLDDNFQGAPDSPRTLQLYLGCVNVFRRDK